MSDSYSYLRKYFREEEQRRKCAAEEAERIARWQAENDEHGRGRDEELSKPLEFEAPHIPMSVRADSSKATAPEPRKIIPITEPKTKDDWFYAIRDCVREFEKEQKYTPNETELWVRLKTNPPSTYGIETNTRGDLTIAEESPMDREAFRKRFGRLYPP